ncbi:MAG: ATP-dependent Clp protease adaptor ClpS [Fimbriimonadales bacterium]|nr:ATP-dependent Clp protease adaptor ClpS [Fimbriimonadales bacterium]
MTKHVEIEEPVRDDVTTGGKDRYMTLIYNNDYNTFDEVIQAIMRATGCSFQEAYMETWEAHTFGKAPIHFASQEECLQVARLVSEIGVKTEVRKEWDA